MVDSPRRVTRIAFLFLIAVIAAHAQHFQYEAMLTSDAQSVEQFESLRVAAFDADAGAYVNVSIVRSPQHAERMREIAADIVADLEILAEDGASILYHDVNREGTLGGASNGGSTTVNVRFDLRTRSDFARINHVRFRYRDRAWDFELKPLRE